MSKTSINYRVLDKYFKTTDIKNTEKYALLSHYLQLQGTESAEKYSKILINDFGINVEELPQTELFNEENNTPFQPSKETTFTFIDLFAGIGGFRLAMQNNGGRCVFSSEWDDAAKQTYFENYGEVPFGDITKKEIKDLIPKHFDVLCAGFPCQPFSYSGQKKDLPTRPKGLYFLIYVIF